MTYGSGLLSHGKAGRSSHRCSGISPILVLAVRNVATEGGLGFLLDIARCMGIFGGLGGGVCVLNTSGDAKIKSKPCSCCRCSIYCWWPCISSSYRGFKAFVWHAQGRLPSGVLDKFAALISGGFTHVVVIGDGVEILLLCLGDRKVDEATETTEVPLFDRIQPPRARGSGPGLALSFHWASTGLVTVATAGSCLRVLDFIPCFVEGCA